MGVIKQGILGGVSGRIGNVVGSSWKGIAVLKSLPLSVANPRTVGQVAQRDKLKGIVALSRQILGSIIQPLWNPFAQRQSGYNAFVSQNIDTFTGDLFTEFADFFSQRGALTNVASPAVTATKDDNTIQVTWTDNDGVADALGSDDVNILIYNETQDVWYSDPAAAKRLDQIRDLVVSTIETSDVLRVYVGASRPNFSRVSDSSYITTTVAAS
jgi:hypothetical protein